MCNFFCPEYDKDELVLHCTDRSVRFLTKYSTLDHACIYYLGLSVERLCVSQD